MNNIRSSSNRRNKMEHELIFERRIEEASLNSWPALQQLLFDGWIIRFAQGYTKRANSVTPLYPALLDAEEKIAYCERFYQEKQLPCTFRLPSFSAESQKLDQILAERGYGALDLTHVLSVALHKSAPTNNPAFQTLSLADWFPIYQQFSTLNRGLQDLHHDLLERIPPPFMYAAIYQEGRPVACSLGVLEHDAFGIFDVVTDPVHRHKGYGRQLVTAMLAWAADSGAQYAYLQVMETNQIAQQMYVKLGFQQCYDYWYRQRRHIPD